MAYNKDVFKKIADSFSSKRLRAEEEADNRRFTAEMQVEGLREIHLQLSENGFAIFGAALSGGDVEAKLARIKEANDALRQKKRDLLLGAGLPEDYTEPRYECDLCHDTGYCSGKMCRCFKEALVLAEIEHSGLGQLVKTQRFDSFSFDFYAKESEAIIRRNFNMLKEFAENFSGKGDSSWLLMGGTGLGKTHLSSSVAVEVIHKGFDVVYMTSGSMFSVFEKQRFGDGSVDDGSDEKFHSADLLIIDDLGTEMVNQFTLSCLYNVINSRTVNGKSTIINTNLTREELLHRYSDRITSRLFGEFKPLLFVGKDIRAQKLAR